MTNRPSVENGPSAARATPRLTRVATRLRSAAVFQAPTCHDPRLTEHRPRQSTLEQPAHRERPLSKHSDHLRTAQARPQKQEVEQSALLHFERNSLITTGAASGVSTTSAVLLPGLVGLTVLHDCCQNRDDLRCLLNQQLHRRGAAQLGRLDEPQPVLRFASFSQ